MNKLTACAHGLETTLRAQHCCAAFTGTASVILSIQPPDGARPKYLSGLSISLPPEVGSSRAVARSAVSRFVRGAEGVVPRR